MPKRPHKPDRRREPENGPSAWEDGADDLDEGPDEPDRDDDDAPAEMACPSCRATVTEDTQKCPQCGDWITPVDPGRRGWRGMVWAGVITLMVVLVALRAC